MGNNQKNFLLCLILPLLSLPTQGSALTPDVSGTFSKTEVRGVEYTWKVEGVSYQLELLSGLFPPKLDILEAQFYLKLKCCPLTLEMKFLYQDMLSKKRVDVYIELQDNLGNTLYTFDTPKQPMGIFDLKIHTWKSTDWNPNFPSALNGTAVSLPGDTLILKVKLQVPLPPLIEDFRLDWKVPVCGFGREAANLIATDIEFSKTGVKVGDDIVPVPRTFLSSKSPVFKEIFKNRTGIVELNDGIGYDAETFRYFVIFSFANDIEIVPEGKELDLMKLGDKYGFEGLKIRAQKATASRVNETNAVEFLEFADANNATELRSFISNYIEKKAVTLTREEWMKNFGNRLGSKICQNLKKVPGCMDQEGNKKD